MADSWEITLFTHIHKKRHFLSKTWDIQGILVWLARPQKTKTKNSRVHGLFSQIHEIANKQTVNNKSWLHVLTWLNVRKQSPTCLIIICYVEEGFASVFKANTPAAELASSLGCLPVHVLQRLHNLRKLTVWGIRSTRWQALASSPRFTSPVL